MLQEHLETLRDEGLSKTPEFAHFLAVFVHSNHDEAGNLLVDQILEDGLHYGGGCDLGDLDSLTSGLWTMSLLPRTASHFNAKSAQVFECVYSNSARILSSEVSKKHFCIVAHSKKLREKLPEAPELNFILWPQFKRETPEKARFKRHFLAKMRQSGSSVFVLQTHFRFSSLFFLGRI